MNKLVSCCKQTKRSSTASIHSKADLPLSTAALALASLESDILSATTLRSYDNMMMTQTHTFIKNDIEESRREL